MEFLMFHPIIEHDGNDSCQYGTFLQQLECGYEFPALIHVWIASAGVLEWFISTSGEATSACKPF